MVGVTTEAEILLIVTGNPAQLASVKKEYLVASGMLKMRSSNCYRISLFLSSYYSCLTNSFSLF